MPSLSSSTSLVLFTPSPSRSAGLPSSTNEIDVVLGSTSMRVPLLEVPQVNWTIFLSGMPAALKFASGIENSRKKSSVAPNTAELLGGFAGIVVIRRLPPTASLTT
jgi:hypothetical protein